MEQYWDCGLCRIEDKGRAIRCRTCRGRLRGRERLLQEIREARAGRLAVVLSALLPGLGHLYRRRWLASAVWAVLLLLVLGLVAATWQQLTHGYAFVAAAVLFVAALAALDARLGPSVPVAPCQRACPAGVDIPDYLQLTLDAAYEQGHSLLRTRIPLVGVIGRVCHQPCEARCVRGIDGQPIAINGCKRFLADRHRESGRGRGGKGDGPEPRKGSGRLSVGVVGSGPAGVACAYYLSVLGASVTVYEAEGFPGGRLATTIPDYRLPRGVLEEELEELRARGVQFRLGCPVGGAGVGVGELLGRHRALFLGVGAQGSVGLEIPGAEAAVDFQAVLRAAKGGNPLPLGARVAVIGGGDAALDVCRTAVRAGAVEVHLLYRRTRDEMPARDEEVEEAVREGVRLHFLGAPVAFRAPAEGGGAVVLQRMRLGERDGSGRPSPVPVDGDRWTLEVDSLVPAVGQRVAGGVFEDPLLRTLRRHPDGTVRVDPRTQRTSLERVYAGGDAVLGAATVVEALAQGRRAALSIFGDHAPEEVSRAPLPDRRIRQPFPGHRETESGRIREGMPRLPLESRVGTFREVEEGYGEASARREAGRCLQCHREL